MEFEKYFDQPSSESPNTNLQSLDEVRSILESFAEKVNDPFKTPIELFIEKYGDPQKFVLGGFHDMIEPYADAMRETLYDMLKKSPVKEYMPVLCGASLDVANNLTQLHLKNSFGVPGADFAQETAKKIIKLEQEFSTTSPKERLMNIAAVLQYAQLCLAELTVNSIMKEMENNQQ